MLASAFGWTHPEMMRLTIRQVRAYHGQIDRLHAARTLSHLDVAIAPNMKPEDVTTLRNDLLRRAKGEPPEEPRLITSQAELARFIKSGGRL